MRIRAVREGARRVSCKAVRSSLVAQKDSNCTRSVRTLGESQSRGEPLSVEVSVRDHARVQNAGTADLLERTLEQIIAAIPLDLLEGELFGHEKCAFSGAIAQGIRRFDIADKGTLFLDEVGDIPPALQPKLLRVLQEQEFESLGSARTHEIDVRLVAATNRDLAKMVARGQFRSDLYDRLNVFPILLPPLREHREDIPSLVTPAWQWCLFHRAAWSGRTV